MNGTHSYHIQSGTANISSVCTDSIKKSILYGYEIRNRGNAKRIMES